MKKFGIALLLSASMLLSACGEAGGEQKTPPEEPRQTEQAASVPTQPAPAPEETEKPAEKVPEPTPEPGSVEQKNALRQAKNYLNMMAFSRDGLVKQLKFEGYPEEMAAYAADNCGADWKEQAAKAAENYLDMTAFSRDGLMRQLEFEGYTEEEAAFGVECVMGAAAGEETSAPAGEDGVSVERENALRAAEQYLDVTAFSHDRLVSQLGYEGYGYEDAVYAADNCGADWMEQAERAAEQYLDLMAFSRESLIDQLIHDGYTPEQAAHGADANGM